MFGFGRSKSDALFDALYRSPTPPRQQSEATDAPITVSVSDLGAAPLRQVAHDGEKFAGGLGAIDLLFTDYWTLRQRSSDLFKRNIYGRGIIRRLVTNEINTGLHLESTPQEKILGLPEESLGDWSEEVETRFQLWSDTPELCDHTEQMTFGALQAEARREALIAGDVLVVLRQDRRTKLPRVELIKGENVQTPLSHMLGASGSNKVKHGVEIDDNGRHVAYHVRQGDGSSKRLPARGEKSGRRLAWMVYGTDKRLDEVRGEPLLSIAIQSLKEIDRYRDSTQRKATINSHLAMVVEKGEQVPGTRPITAGATRKGSIVTQDQDGTTRAFSIAEQVPGVVVDELQHGEKVKPFPSTGTDERFGDFEESIIQAVAWCLEIPPEILRQSFSNNYSASQAAINEFKIYLNKVRADFGRDFCQPIYVDWLTSAVLAKAIEARGMIEAWRDSSSHAVFAAWVCSDWSGHIKPAVDMTKLVRAYKEAVAEGFISRGRAARELFGLKYSQIVRLLKRENEQLSEANESIVEATQPPAAEPTKADDKVADEDPDAIDNEDDAPAAAPKNRKAS